MGHGRNRQISQGNAEADSGLGRGIPLRRRNEPGARHLQRRTPVDTFLECCFLPVLGYLTDVVVVPFNIEYVKGEGAASADEFTEWVSRHGDSFLHDLRNVQGGNVLVFAWKLKRGEWIMVGDAIVQSNHATGSKWSCCAGTKGYSRHILAAGLRIYPTRVSTKMIGAKLGSFANLTPKQYFQVLSETVGHWQSI